MPERLILEGFGAWYAQKMGDHGDNWHRTLIDPGLLSVIGTVAPGTQALDVGCGNGYLARWLARRGARVTGVDLSAELISAARAWERREPLGIVYMETDAAHLPALGEGTFDLAIANMSLMDVEDADGVFREVARVVRSGGRFVFSISHPCFDVDKRSEFVVEGPPAGPLTVFRKVTNYRTPHSERYAWDLDEGRTAITTGYHRPLSWYMQRMKSHGWCITDLEEPVPREGFQSRRFERAWIEDIPLHLVVGAKREPRP